MIPAGVDVLDGTDVGDAWDRFEVFEALHHTMQICNPMTSAEVDEAIQSLDLADGTSLLDVACGYGEFLLRCADRGAVSGVGIDLSPWMISTAHDRAQRQKSGANLRWVLGDGRHYQPAETPDIAICIGAEWVWHDFNGTARALAERLGPNSGGVAVIGAARLHHQADRDMVYEQRGRIDTVDDMHRMLVEHGFEPFHRIDPDDAGWDDYLARTAVAATQWAELHPGPRAEQFIVEQHDWQRARERDRDVIGWSLWMAQKSDPRA